MQIALNSTNMNSTDLDGKIDLRFVVLQLFVYFMFVVLGVVGNTLVILTVYKRPPLQRVSYYLVCALATEDLLMSLMSALNYPQGLIRGQWVMGETMCVIVAYISSSLTVAELMFLTAITLDRYLACCWSLHYSRLVTVTRIKRAIVVCVLISFITATSALYGCGSYRYSLSVGACQIEWSFSPIDMSCAIVIFSIGIMPCSVALPVCQYKTLKEVRKVTHNAPPNVYTGRHTLGNSGISSQSSSGSTRKATLTLSLVNATYLVCWVPFVVVRCLSVVVDWNKSDTTFYTLSILERTTLFVFMVSKFANPIIYGVYNQEFRRELKRMFRGQY